MSAPTVPGRQLPAIVYRRRAANLRALCRWAPVLIPVARWLA